MRYYKKNYCEKAQAIAKQKGRKRINKLEGKYILTWIA